MSTFEWDGLQVVLEVHRAGSLAAAGRALGINSTTVGRRLGAFETTVGASLFVRTREGLLATEAGEALVEHAEAMERHASLAHRAIAGDSTALEGTVRLAAAESLATHFLVDHLASLRTQHPRIVVELIGSSQLVDLTRGEIDLALRFSRPGAAVPVPPDHGEVRAQRVAVLGIGIYASRDYLDQHGAPDHADDIRGHQILTCKADATHMPGFRWMEAAEGRNTVALRTNSTQVMAAGAAAGLGLAALPAFIVSSHKHLVQITPPDAVDSRDLWLLMPPEARRVARIRAIRDLLVDLLDHWEPVLSGRTHPAKLRRRSARPS